MSTSHDSRERRGLPASSSDILTAPGSRVHASNFSGVPGRLRGQLQVRSLHPQDHPHFLTSTASLGVVPKTAVRFDNLLGLTE